MILPYPVPCLPVTLPTSAVPLVEVFAQCHSSESIFVVHTKVKMLTTARLLRWWQQNAR